MHSAAVAADAVAVAADAAVVAGGVAAAAWYIDRLNCEIDARYSDSSPATVNT